MPVIIEIWDGAASGRMLDLSAIHGTMDGRKRI